jgi:uncharacterized protein YaaQ
MEQSQIDRLTIVVMQIQDVEGVFDALCESGIACTHLSSSGGFLGGRNVTLLIGLTQGQEEQVVQILQKRCRRRVEYVTTSLEGAPFYMPLSTPVTVGGATVFTMAVERYEVYE